MTNKFFILHTLIDSFGIRHHGAYRQPTPQKSRLRRLGNGGTIAGMTQISYSADAVVANGTPSHTTLPPYLLGLNEPQRQAVETLEGPVLVLAGAGTGKTKVLTSRIGHLLLARKAFANQVLAVTFTNKAAREMRERLSHLVGGVAESVWLGTFHSLCVRILRKHAEAVGLAPSFTILDADDQLRLIKKLLPNYALDEKRYPPRMLAATIQRWKDRGLLPHQLTSADLGSAVYMKIRDLYAEYQARLQNLNACDFGDLILLCLHLFKTDAEILAQYQQQFRYILVDEYQDTNVAQYMWLRLLAQNHRNLCCVGDDDQSIYSWRGAEVGNILRFGEDFPGAVIIRLEQNYRSTPEILQAASGLIANNEGRLGKTLWTEATTGTPIAVWHLWDDVEEARSIGDQVELLRREGHLLGDMAILVRAGFQTRSFEERFLAIGLPYRVIGGPRFYERAEVRDALAYLRLVVQPSDDMAFERVINTPKRGLGEASLQLLNQTARSLQIPLLGAATQLVDTEELKPAARKALQSFVDQIRRWRSQIEAQPPAELAGMVLDESGYTAMWKNDPAPDSAGRLENLKELLRAIEGFDTITGFLEHIALVMDNASENAEDMVTIMTLHAAKGLEYQTVFLPGWEEGLFPHQKALDETGPAGLEEERRLAYVGITRAKKSLTITHAANRRVHGQWQQNAPSRFLEELPAQLVELRQSFQQGSQRLESVRQDHGQGSGWGRNRFGGDGGGGGGSRRGNDGGGSNSYAKQLLGQNRSNSYAPPSGVALAPRADGLAIGARVRHELFGQGIVTAVDGTKLEVRFDGIGSKKVMAGFVRAVSSG
jgi:DNA helicase-2/ATP-dependent DNA helicase PcrA